MIMNMEWISTSIGVQITQTMFCIAQIISKSRCPQSSLPASGDIVHCFRYSNQSNMKYVTVVDLWVTSDHMNNGNDEYRWRQN